MALAEESTLNDVQARLRSLKRKALLGADDGNSFFRKKKVSFIIIQFSNLFFFFLKKKEVDDRTLLKRAGRAGGKAEPVADEVDAFEARLEALRQTEEERKAGKPKKNSNNHN